MNRFNIVSVRPLVNRRLPARLLAVAASVAIALASVPDAGAALVSNPTVPHNTPPSKVAPYHAPVNKHLHGVETQAVAGVHAHTRWVHYWNSAAWFSLHRGTGVIQGVVRTGGGLPMPGMDVRLRHANGHGFRSAAAKHITSTGSGGLFTMTRVRAGRYRVHTAGAGRSGNAQIVVHAGTVASVNVKVSG